MKKFTKRDEKIFSDLKACFKELKLPIKAEKKDDEYMFIKSEFQCHACPIEILMLLDPHDDTVTLSIHYGIAPSEKIETLYELINRINDGSYTNHFVVAPNTGEVAMLGGMCFTDDRINGKEFQRILRQMLCDSYNFAPLILKQILSDEKPAEIFRKFMKENMPWIEYE